MLDWIEDDYLHLWLYDGETEIWMQRNLSPVEHPKEVQDTLEGDHEYWLLITGWTGDVAEYTLMIELSNDCTDDDGDGDGYGYFAEHYCGSVNCNDENKKEN